jgi:hypothetical protein
MVELDKYFSKELDPKIQYASIEQGIKAFAETYSFNIESELFNQLTKEQQALWRKEIEQAVISGGEEGIELSRDIRYKENIEVDLKKEIKEEYLKRRCYYGKDNILVILNEPQFNNIAKHFFELGLKAQKGE